MWLPVSGIVTGSLVVGSPGTPPPSPPPPPPSASPPPPSSSSPPPAPPPPQPARRTSTEVEHHDRRRCICSHGFPAAPRRQTGLFPPRPSHARDAPAAPDGERAEGRREPPPRAGPTAGSTAAPARR